jgi:hypothetical protein
MPGAARSWTAKPGWRHDVGRKVFDVIAGKRYFRAWMAETLRALDRVAHGRAESNDKAAARRP